MGALDKVVVTVLVELTFPTGESTTIELGNVQDRTHGSIIDRISKALDGTAGNGRPERIVQVQTPRKLHRAYNDPNKPPTHNDVLAFYECVKRQNVVLRKLHEYGLSNRMLAGIVNSNPAYVASGYKPVSEGSLSNACQRNGKISVSWHKEMGGWDCGAVHTEARGHLVASALEQFLKDYSSITHKTPK